MKTYQLIMGAVFLFILGACSKDLGNYDYQEINELTIKDINEEYTLRTGLDTLSINPNIAASMDGNDLTRYTYNWILRIDNKVFDTLSRAKDINYPVRLAPGEYAIFYRVLDKMTGVSWASNVKLKVVSPYSRGLLIMGEDPEGYAEAEMLSMQSDTIHVRHMLSGSGLPRLRGPLGMVHTGGSSAYVRLWAMTREGSYFLDRASMTATLDNHLGRYVFMSDIIDPKTLNPVVIAPQIRTATGDIGSTLYRALVTQRGDIFANLPLLMAGDFYNNPVNRVTAAPDELIPAAPYLLYPINGMNNVMWYDTRYQRFLNYTGIGLSTTSMVLADKDGEAFPWNQPAGRTLVYAENTRNTDGGSNNGNSFALMKDKDNSYHIYKFYANGTNPAKRDAYTVKSIATDFDKAEGYAFSSNRSIICYFVGSRLYAYDYNPGFEKIYTFPELGTDAITMIKFDTQIDHLTNSLYIASYKDQKGILRRFKVGNNPNIVELQLQDNSTWTDLIKIQSINWRAVN